MKGIYFDKSVSVVNRKNIRLPGWWFGNDPGHLIRVIRSGNRFNASIYCGDFAFGKPPAGQSVIGSYRTVMDAMRAASIRIAHADSPHLCSWNDVKAAREVRREVDARLAAQGSPLATAVK